MERKPTDPLSGCFVLIVGSFVLLLAFGALLKGLGPSVIDTGKLIKRLSSVFVGIVFWLVVISVLSGSRRQ